MLNASGFTLRAHGRLHEAADLLRLGLERDVAREDLKNASVAANNLGELLQARGALRDALKVAEQSVELADKGVDAFQRTVARTTLATVQHNMGRRKEAQSLFLEAEDMQEERWPQYPWLHSLAGSRYCDLLLERGLSASVRVRAKEAISSQKRRTSLLDVALDHLSLGRAHPAGLQRSTGGGNLNEVKAHLQQAVDGVRNAGRQDYLPLGLLARAELYIHTREFANARRDLDEAMTIATRCGFRLHECDAHLGYARLAIAEGSRAKAGEHMEKARNIVNDTGYHRRDEELAALETQIASMPETAKSTITASDLSERTNTEGMSHVNPSNESFDIAIICALHDPEFDKVRRAAPGSWEPFHVSNDSTTYEKTTYTTKSGRILSVVAAAASQMGMPASAVLATKMLLHFRPKLVAMVGIAAGVSSEKQGVGNILTPFTTFDYASGKIFENEKEQKLEFAPDPKPLEIRRRIQDRLSIWRREREQLDDICKSWGAEPPPTRLNIHTEPVGSGPSVLGTSKSIADIHEHWRKLGGIEMEAHGVHLACHDADVAFLCVKSICDFADKKDDRWQHYAAFTAAQFCYRFLIAEWETLGFR